jgi:DNA-binding beta-propeller fold protein YncE
VTTDVAQPEGIAVDRQGNVFVANSTTNTITVYNPQGTLIYTLKGTREVSAGFSSTSLTEDSGSGGSQRERILSGLQPLTN